MDTTEQLKKLYSSQLASQKEHLQQDYMKADAEYAAEKEKAQKATDANLTRTAVEAQKTAVSTAELHNAYGLSSGARAQARLAQENQLLANLTALRTHQQELDADVERQRSLLSQQYQSAIRQAQAENDLAKAQALYEEARRKQDALTAQQQAQSQYALEAAKLMADAGDYTRLAAIYGLSNSELEALMGETAQPPTAVPEAVIDRIQGAEMKYDPMAQYTQQRADRYESKFGVSLPNVFTTHSKEPQVIGDGVDDRLPLLENNGYSVTNYTQAVSRLRNMGVYDHVVQNLLSEADFTDVQKENKRVLASGDGTYNPIVGQYSTYAEYLRGYLTMAEQAMANKKPGYTGNYVTGTGGRYGTTGSAM